MSGEAFYELVEQTRQTWQQVYDRLVIAKYDLVTARASIGGLTVEQLHRKALLVTETFLAIRPQDPDSQSWVAIEGRTAESSAAFTSFKNHAEGIANHLRQHCKDGSTIRDGNGNFLFGFYLNEANSANVDLSAYFSHIYSALNTLLNALSTLLPFCNAPNVSDLTLRAQALGDSVRDIEIARNDARKLKQAIENATSQAEAREKEIQNLHAKAEIALSQLQALQAQGNIDAGSVTALIEKIKAVGNSADTLEKQVDTYKSTFEAFQITLEKRNLDFTEFEEKHKTAVAANVQREAEIDRLAALADSMITGATTAGLAKSMEDARARYESRMNGARRGFYLAVCLLVVSATPLASHLFPGLFGPSLLGVDFKPDSSPYGLISKIALMLPATWLTAFFTKSHADFFHLEREYAHKAALAMSVDGFKRQAQKYQEEITAEVFMEIRMNPAHRLGTEPASHPLYNVLAKVVGGFLHKDKKLDDRS